MQRLRPTTFTWRDGGTRDVGFGAEQVAEVEPLLGTYNQDSQIEGVKYAQVTTVLVNAVNEQQVNIEQLKEQIQCATAPSRRAEKARLWTERECRNMPAPRGKTSNDNPV